MEVGLPKDRCEMDAYASNKGNIKTSVGNMKKLANTTMIICNSKVCKQWRSHVSRKSSEDTWVHRYGSWMNV